DTLGPNAARGDWPAPLCLPSHHELPDPLAEPDTEHPRNLRKEQRAERAEQSAAKHRFQRERRADQEGSQHDPAPRNRRLAIEEEDQEPATKGSGQKEEQVVRPRRVGVPAAKAKIERDDLCNDGEQSS